MAVNGFIHFYEFYGKLNVVCDLHSKTKDMNVTPMVLLVGTIFGTGANSDTEELNKIIAKIRIIFPILNIKFIIL